MRKGNEGLLIHHPFLNEVMIWDKKKDKFLNLVKTGLTIRNKKYDEVINLHRFASSGLITFLSGAKEKIGFDKNPFSFSYTKKIRHEIGNGKHEILRNHELIRSFTDDVPEKPRLYPSKDDVEAVSQWKTKSYVTVSPASVWFTKQFPKEKWMELIGKLPDQFPVYLLGSPADVSLCGEIKSHFKDPSSKIVVNLAGKLSFLESAALMKDAKMNYTNDSAPLHLAGAMNAPVTTVFCSTIPGFGFGPLSDVSRVIETKEKLDCRPCGLHGFKACPQGHFKCAFTIDVNDLLLNEAK